LTWLAEQASASEINVFAVKKEPELPSWEKTHQTTLCVEGEIRLAAERKSWGSLRPYTGRRAASARVPVRHRAGASKREEALNLKLLLQLCICSESRV